MATATTNKGVLHLVGGEALSKKIEALKDVQIEDLGEGISVSRHNATLYDAFQTLQKGGYFSTFLSPLEDGECGIPLRNLVVRELGERTGLGVDYFADLWITYCAD